MSKTRGLSLLEVLVTITVFALLMVVLSAGWFQSMQAQQRLAAVAGSVEQHRQIELLLRQSMSEALTPPLDQGQAFFADPSGFDVETSTPLQLALGAAASGLQMRVETLEQSVGLVLLGPGANRRQAWPWRFELLRFQYADSRGELHPQWPPGGRKPDAYGSDQHLPKLIHIDYRLVGEQRTRSLVIAPVAASWLFTEAKPPFAAAINN